MDGWKIEVVVGSFRPMMLSCFLVTESAICDEVKVMGHVNAAILFPTIKKSWISYD